ncbi:ABC transporter permease [Xanthobacter sp. VTT E-85241]|uniref:ABC transporter permease n=1 Tax=Roseixanthobacter finlandensis TaxID=3119922 RepID=UPI00372B2336
MSDKPPIHTSLKTLSISILLFVLLIGLWEFAVRYLQVPAFIVPAPSSMFRALYQGIASGLYVEHVGVTLIEILAGFAIGSSLGLLLGVGIATNRYMAYFLYPYVVVFQSLPKVAIAPLIVLWFGLGITSKIVAGALICFFAVMVNTIAGLRAVEQDRVDLIRSLGGSDFQVFWMLRLPSAMPFIMAGLEIALTFAMIGVIVAEFLGAERGLGMLMQSMNFSMDVAGSFSILVVLAALGLVLNRIIIFARHRLIYWEQPAGVRGSEPPDSH